MKTKYLIALILVLVGTNLFTFATTRYWTTKHVLTRAQERMNSALRKEGLYERVYQSGGARSAPLHSAIPEAGGMYYWWNDGLLFWGAAVLLTLSGLAVTRYGPLTKDAG